MSFGIFFSFWAIFGAAQLAFGACNTVMPVIYIVIIIMWEHENRNVLFEIEYISIPVVGPIHLAGPLMLVKSEG